MANSADPDQSSSEKPTDLDLHCLERHPYIYQVYPDSAGQGLKSLSTTFHFSHAGMSGCGMELNHNPR